MLHMAEFSGHLRLRAEWRDHGKTVLAQQSFRAPFHVGKSYWDEDGKTLRVQVVNPTAGILEGDRLETEVSVGSGAALLVTTPSASRVFHMRSGEAVAAQRFAVESGGWLEFLPEPLVPHQASRYRQVTEIDVAEGGEIAFADLLMPGRLARGEAWSWSRLALTLSVRAGGELILRERLDQSGEELRALATLSGIGGRKNEEGRAKGENDAGSDKCCFGNLVIVSRALDADGAWREKIEALHGSQAWIGVSALRGNRGGWSVKIVAMDGAELRRVMTDVRASLAEILPRLKTSLRRV